MDNEGAIALAENSVDSSNSKHIDTRHHFLRELLVEKKNIEVEHVRSAKQHADILTNALPCEASIVHHDFILA